MNGNKAYLTVLLIIFVGAPALMQPVTIDINQLVQWAEKDELGYKTANLMQLKQLIQGLHGTLPAGYDVQVPQFYGISAKEIEKVLQHKNTVKLPTMPKNRRAQANKESSEQTVNLDVEWATILKNTVTPEMLKSHTVTTEFIKASKELAQKIEDKFSEAAYVIQKMPFTFKDQNKCYIDLASIGFDPEVASSIEALVSNVALNKGLVTLRSTGLREDTEKVANAGGNESCEIVRATLAETVKNMGEVAASYLQAKSLLQRSGKDEKIFEKPQLPVLLQEVVGEHTGNPVISCVAYSQERQGNTKGVSATQCNYGHGKSVVDSMFPVDTYYIDDTTKATFPVIRIKTKRMVPHFGTTFELQETNNNKELQAKPALDAQAQQAIHIIMMELEKAYGRPMDVELVVDPIKKIVYLVQARPIVYETQKTNPIYVSEAVTFDANKTIAAQKIYVPGAVYFLKPDNILVTTNLESALKSVLDNEAKQQQNPHLIIVKEPGAITSHAGATLAGKGIVLLQVEDQKPLQNLLAKKDSSLLIDSQRGLIIDITGDERFGNHNQSTLLSKGLLKEGWFNHPIPTVMSVETSFDTQTIEAALASYGKRKNPMPEKTTSDLLNLLKEAPEKQAHQALESILIRVAQEIDKLEQEKTCKDVESICKANSDQAICKVQARMGTTCFKEHAATEAIKNLQSVFNELLKISHSISPLLQLPSRDTKRLLVANFLEALLTQEPSSVIVNALSVANIKNSYEQEIDFIIKKLAPMTGATPLISNKKLLKITQKGTAAAPTKEMEELWITFTGNLEKTLTPAQLENFIVMAEAIDSLGALPIWVYTRIIPSLAEKVSFATLADQLLHEFQNSKKIMTTLQENNQKVIAFDADYSIWEDPKKFEINLKNLTNLLHYFTSSEFLEIFSHFKNQETLTLQLSLRMFTIPIMEKLVAVVDQIIKIVKASTIYNETTKVAHFKRLLQNYLSLLKAWASIMAKYAKPGYNNQAVATKIENLTNYLDKASLEKYQLEPSKNFDVRQATFSAQASGSYMEPETMEDIFTTIHQDLLEIISNLQSTIVKKSVPGLFGHINELLRIVAMPLSESVDKDGTLKNVYIKKYLHHSVSIELASTKSSEDATITFKFDGRCPNRWQVMKIIAQIIGMGAHFSIENVTETQYGPRIGNSLRNGTLTWSYRIDKNSDLNQLPDSVNILWQIGFGTLKATDIMPFIEKAFKKDPSKTLNLLMEGLTLVPGFANVIAEKIEKHEIDEVNKKAIFNWLSSQSGDEDKYIKLRKNSILSLLINAKYEPALPIAFKRIQNKADDWDLTEALINQNYKVKEVIKTVYNNFYTEPRMISGIYFLTEKEILDDGEIRILSDMLKSKFGDTSLLDYFFSNAVKNRPHNKAESVQETDNKSMQKTDDNFINTIYQNLLSLFKRNEPEQVSPENTEQSDLNKPEHDDSMLRRIKRESLGYHDKYEFGSDLCDGDNDILKNWNV